MAALGRLVRDMYAFPAACLAGTEYKEMEEKARDFLHSTARVAIACCLVWGLYKGQRWDVLRKLTVPVALCAVKMGRVSFSIEPISMLINIYLIKTARSKWIVGTYCAALGVWQCIAQTFQQWKSEAPVIFFKASIRQAGILIDPLSNLMRIALWKIPESRLGIGCFTVTYGIRQLNFYTIERWNLRDAPTDHALKGILHILFGLGWIGAYEYYNQSLEKDGAKKETYLYRAANYFAPHLARATAGTKAT
jgi:hypothetical protein